ncbi:MAG TPA: helix-turn-helix transcriptional regulator [Rhizomicrobium sp.]|nr:helix-turn-helix transcriptional regulator [Rhizomicrobium sp.]
MALFFDSAWFDQKLAKLGLAQATVAAALGLTDEEVREIWKDQRELKARDVAILANLLGTSPEEIAHRAGVSTPVPQSSSDAGLRVIEERLARIEEKLDALLRERK